jgi:hypothetical protein
MSETVELDADGVEEVMSLLEDLMDNSETALAHDEIRPTTALMANDGRAAYRTLVAAHPDYELQRNDD